ncbi:MAG: ATPase, T2SS/T4P/T4SS family, partial [Candidatus Omnitrophota bacterium]|nr:ATPase, T2SS/T4P/T4SS family [Candidatus Omnitrophota bacterium]
MVEREIRNLIHQFLIKKTDFIKVKDKLTEDQMRIFVDKAISDMCREEEIELATEERITLIRELVTASVSLGPLRTIMEDKAISEIMINGYNKVYIQKFGKLELTDIKFLSNDHLLHTVQKLLSLSGTSRRVDESSPYVDFSLPDGSRVNVIIPPCSLA